MLRSLKIALLLGLLAALPVSGEEWAKKMFESTDHDFGTVARGVKAEFDFALSNIFVEDVHIASARSSCGCTSLQVVNPSLKTYEKGAIRATFNTKAFLGQRGATVTVVIDRPYYAEVQLHTKGFIRSDVIFEPDSVQLGQIEQGETVERKVALGYSGRNDWRIVGVKSSNPNISAEAVETGRSGGQAWYDLVVRVGSNIPLGDINDQVTIVTNDLQGGQIPIMVGGRVQSGITVSPASLFMGVVKPGETATKSLVVKGKKPFRILSISCDDKSFEFGKESDQAPKSVHVIPVTFAAGANSGKVTKAIRIETDSDSTTPELAAYAVVATP
jgi:hypothetical protein